MAVNWQDFMKTSPHEIVISGPKHSKQIEDEKGLNDIIFRLCTLNFMEVSKTSLNVLSNKIKDLNNLTALMLYDNKLDKLPKEIGLLKKLKTLDVSNNQISELPEDIANLTELQSLNLINNKIERLPDDLSAWSNLIVIKFSHNSFKQFPKGLCSPTFKQHLTEIHATDNEIADLPTGIGYLSALRQLDLTNNKIEHIPGELADCVKLKSLLLKENPIKDVRLHKLAEKNPTKQILQYVAKSCPRGGVKSENSKPLGSKARRKRLSSSSTPVEGDGQPAPPEAEDN